MSLKFVERVPGPADHLFKMELMLQQGPHQTEPLPDIAKCRQIYCRTDSINRF